MVGIYCIVNYQCFLLKIKNWLLILLLLVVSSCTKNIMTNDIITCHILIKFWNYNETIRYLLILSTFFCHKIINYCEFLTFKNDLWFLSSVTIRLLSTIRYYRCFIILSLPLVLTLFNKKKRNKEIIIIQKWTLTL